MSGKTVGAFVYCAIADTVLTSGTTLVRIMSDEVNGQDSWGEAASLSITTSAVATPIESNYHAGTCGPTPNNDGGGLMYVPLNMKYF